MHCVYAPPLPLSPKHNPISLPDAPANTNSFGCALGNINVLSITTLAPSDGPPRLKYPVQPLSYCTFEMAGCSHLPAMNDEIDHVSGFSPLSLSGLLVPVRSTANAAKP